MSFWDWAEAAYGRDGVEAACLALQDEHGQSVAFLLWAAWAAEAGRTLDYAQLSAAQGVADRWEGRVTGPLRQARRELSGVAAEGEAQDLRDQVKAAELAAERRLMEALEAIAPDASGPPLPAREALAAAAGIWRPAASTPDAELLRLADALYPAQVFAIYQPAYHRAGQERREGPARMTDDPPAANDEATLARLAELRQEHQDLDAAVGALETRPQPDQLQIARLKKKKLVLRDQIAELEDQLTPDIIA